MADICGNNIKLSIFGASHGEAIGATIFNLPAGIKVNEESISKALSLRRPQGLISTARVEKDAFRIVSGVFEGYTSGDALTIIIENTNTISKDYSELKIKPRPSHADYVANVKYEGFNDYRGGGHFSGRLSAALVAVCAILRDILKGKGIIIGSHIKQIGNILDDDLSLNNEELESLNNKYFATVSSKKEEEMMAYIEKARDDQDSVGGIIETAILNMPIGVGEPYFDSIESTLARLLFSIGGVKGVEFGAGFNFVNLKGSEANDEFYIDNDSVKTKSNNNGGINGGISNGMPIIIKTAIKPTPSISKKQSTIDMEKKENTNLVIKGRHDPCIVHRVRIVIDSLIAFGLLDLCIEQFGKAWCK